MPTTEHPDDEQLALYVENLLSGAKSADLEQHLGSCVTCYRSVVLGRKLRDAEANGVLPEIDASSLNNLRKRLKRGWRARLRLLPTGQVQRVEESGQAPIHRPAAALYWSRKPQPAGALSLRDAPGCPELTWDGTVLRVRFAKPLPSAVRIHVLDSLYEQQVPDSGEVVLDSVPSADFEIEIVC